MNRYDPAITVLTEFLSARKEELTARYSLEAQCVVFGIEAALNHLKEKRRLRVAKEKERGSAIPPKGGG